MKNETADQTLIVPLPLYNILEAFLAGTSDSFLVLDSDRNVTLFNDNFNEFIRCATGSELLKDISFHSFIDDVTELDVLAGAVEKAYKDGATNKFSFAIGCESKRWYDAEVHPLRQGNTVVGVGIGLFETTHKKEAEEAVKKSEAMFKALVKNSADVFLLTDRLFRITYVSDALRKVSGYEPDTLLGRTAFTLIHPDDQEVIAAWLAQLIDRPTVMKPVEFRSKNSAGNWVYLEAMGQNMLNDEHVAALVFTFRDVQAKKVADQALVNAEQRLTLLLNNTRESFIILNNRFTVTAYNKAAQEHSPFFFKTELQSGLSLLDLIDASETTSYIDILEQVMEDNETSLDTSYTDEAGKLHIYHHTFRRLSMGAEHGIFITSSNITERRLAEIALKENEDKFKTIIEYSFDAVVIIDESATVTYASPSITNLIGYEPAELIGRNGFEFVYADDVPEVRTKLESVISNMEETYADYRTQTKEGVLKWVEAKGKNMFANRHIRGVLISLRDISERKRMLEEQTKLTEEVMKYNKDLQQFSFITSHNLRAPVANLISLLALYNHNDPADVFNAEIIKKFHESADKLNDTLNDLVNVLVIRSKPNADMEYVRFEDVLIQVRENVHALLIAAKGEIFFDFSGAEGIQYNRVHLESIFLNLVSNSIKYSSPERPLKINIRSERIATGVRLDVTDNGIGIDLARYGDRMFGLYQRFNASKEGKGLGLYMIKSQITASGGTISVESELGKGSTFSIVFRQQEA
jgi:PAS domain S-box-containing protein